VVRCQTGSETKQEGRGAALIASPRLQGEGLDRGSSLTRRERTGDQARLAAKPIAPAASKSPTCTPHASEFQAEELRAKDSAISSVTCRWFLIAVDTLDRNGLLLRLSEYLMSDYISRNFRRPSFKRRRRENGASSKVSRQGRGEASLNRIAQRACLQKPSIGDCYA
jgi:hypothetical protein